MRNAKVEIQQFNDEINHWKKYKTHPLSHSCESMVLLGCFFIASDLRPCSDCKTFSINEHFFL